MIPAQFMNSAKCHVNQRASMTQGKGIFKDHNHTRWLIFKYNIMWLFFKALGMQNWQLAKIDDLTQCSDEGGMEDRQFPPVFHQRPHVTLQHIETVKISRYSSC